MEYASEWFGMVSTKWFEVESGWESQSSNVTRSLG